MNCIRGCIRCADQSGAPRKNTDAEEYCKSKCTLTDNEIARFECCVKNDFQMGGCRSFPSAPPKDPNPDNPACINMPIP